MKEGWTSLFHLFTLFCLNQAVAAMNHSAKQSQLALTTPPLFAVVEKSPCVRLFVRHQTFSFFARDLCHGAKWINLFCRSLLLLAWRPPGCTCLHAFCKHSGEMDNIWHPPNRYEAFSFRADVYDHRCPTSSTTKVDIQTCARLKPERPVTFS